MLAGDTRAWYVARAPLPAETPLGVETISARIASVEETNPQDVYIDLVHARLPKLEAEGLLHYNPQVDIVEPTSRPSTVADASEELFVAGKTLTATAN